MWQYPSILQQQKWNFKPDLQKYNDPSSEKFSLTWTNVNIPQSSHGIYFLDDPKTILQDLQMYTNIHSHHYKIRQQCFSIWCILIIDIHLTLILKPDTINHSVKSSSNNSQYLFIPYTDFNIPVPT